MSTTNVKCIACKCMSEKNRMKKKAVIFWSELKYSLHYINNLLISRFVSSPCRSERTYFVTFRDDYFMSQQSSQGEGKFIANNTLKLRNRSYDWSIIKVCDKDWNIIKSYIKRIIFSYRKWNWFTTVDISK